MGHPDQWLVLSQFLAGIGFDSQPGSQRGYSIMAVSNVANVLVRVRISVTASLIVLSAGHHLIQE